VAGAPDRSCLGGRTIRRRLGRRRSPCLGVYAALAGQSFCEVFAIAANHDGDSDSTTSIGGQLYGAWKGMADLPRSWAEQLDVFDPAMLLVSELLKWDSYRIDPDA